jgi:hypothetical protein
MIRKLMSLLLLVSLVAVVPVLAGCEKKEVRTHHQTEIHNHVVEQHEVVE